MFFLSFFGSRFTLVELLAPPILLVTLTNGELKQKIEVKDKALVYVQAAITDFSRPNTFFSV